MGTFVGKVMSLLFNMQSGIVIAFLPRNKCLSIPWLQSPSTVSLEPKKIKSVTTSAFPPFICLEEMELDTMILVFLMLSFESVFLVSLFTLTTDKIDRPVWYIWYEGWYKKEISSVFPLQNWSIIDYFWDQEHWGKVRLLLIFQLVVIRKTLSQFFSNSPWLMT